MTQRWKLTIEYDGTDFVGWQIQKNGMSIQQAIEEAVYKSFGEKTTVMGSGRTDAGVHAVGQVAHVDIERVCTPKEVRDAVNHNLRGKEQTISILKAEQVPSEFHARFDAIHRVYCYKILTGRIAPPAIAGKYVWHVNKDLDVDLMQQGANHLIGEHDFTSFRATACQAESPVREIKRLEVLEVENDFIFGRHLEIWAESRAFLHHQIRNIAGTLKLVGEGAWHPDDVKTALEAKARAKAGITAPPNGLYFVRVDY